jgi:hypothetical protein
MPSRQYQPNQRQVNHLSQLPKPIPDFAEIGHVLKLLIIGIICGVCLAIIGLFYTMWYGYICDRRRLRRRGEALGRTDTEDAEDAEYLGDAEDAENAENAGDAGYSGYSEYSEYSDCSGYTENDSSSDDLDPDTAHSEFSMLWRGGTIHEQIAHD